MILGKKLNIKYFILFFLFILFNKIQLFSQNNINYFGILSDDLDSNMSKMTSDLYYTQLCELSNFTVTDCRNESGKILNEKELDLSDENLNFYFKVTKKEDSKWISSIFLVDELNKKTISESKEYDSFYKILMEPKITLQDNLKKLFDNFLSEKQNKIANSSIINSDKKSFTNIFSTEELSGTWSGESYIDKIVILRGGRGFIIFNNGASMNISLKINKNEDINSVVITQTSRTNASYFPNLDRKIALSAAYNASPIEWKLNIINSDTLEGTKKTLVPSEDGVSAIEGIEKVIWSKKS